MANTKFTLSNYPNNVDDYVQRIAGQVVNANFTSRTDYTDYVLAKDFNALRDAVLATQDTLGENPQATYATVKARLDYLASHNDDYYDQRYVGIKLSTIPVTAPVTPNPTVLGHVHDGKIVSGIQVNPSKIDLTNHVTGTLPSGNILLDIANINALTASKIYVSTGVTIVNALDSKIGTNGGTFTGDITVNGDLTVKTRTQFSSFFEAWAGDNLTAGSGGTSFSDSSHTIGSWNGAAIKNSQKNQGTAARITLCSANTNILRYGLYSVIFRVYMSGIPVDEKADVIHILASDTGNSTTSRDLTVIAEKLTAGWNSVCLTFDHEYSATGANQSNFSITYMNTTPYDIYCDGITVVPAHTAIWG